MYCHQFWNFHTSYCETTVFTLLINSYRQKVSEKIFHLLLEIDIMSFGMSQPA